MNNFTSRLVTDSRLRQILDCYGSESSKWPEEERRAALSLLKGSPDNMSYREEVRYLDRLLKKLQIQENSLTDKPAIQSLQQRIMHSLPEQEITANNISAESHNANDNPVTTRLSHRPGLWVGSIAASLFVVSLSAGIIHQLLNPGQDIPNPQQNNQQTGNEFAQWAWEDITGEPLIAKVDNEPATLMALVELDLPVE